MPKHAANIPTNPQKKIKFRDKAPKGNHQTPSVQERGL